MATERERQLFAANVLTAVGQKAARLPESKVTGFLAMKGRRYNHDMMVVGRAVNGWTKGVSPERLASRTFAGCYSNHVFRSVNAKPCPMRWVTDYWGGNGNYEYNTRRSAFWRVIRGVVEWLEIADVGEDSWPSHLVWSNLYKVAPADGGNPSVRLRQAQRAGCRDLFNLELELYTPSRLLLLTGLDWAAEFVSDVECMQQRDTGFTYVKAVGALSVDSHERPIPYIVADHPQGKRESLWIAEVSNAFNGE